MGRRRYSVQPMEWNIQIVIVREVFIISWMTFLSYSLMDSLLVRFSFRTLTLANKWCDSPIGYTVIHIPGLFRQIRKLDNHICSGEQHHLHTGSCKPSTMKQAFKHTASFASCQIIRAINSDLLVRNHMKCMAASDQFSFNIGYPDHRITGNNCTKSIRCYQVEPHSLQTKLDYHQYMKNHRDNGSYKVKLIQKTTITAWSQNFIFQMYKAILMAGGG